MRVFNEDSFNGTSEENALGLADTLEHFFKELGLRTRLGELGIDDAHFEEMAKRATRNGTVGHYVPLNEEKFVDILRLAL